MNVDFDFSALERQQSLAAHRQRFLDTTREFRFDDIVDFLGKEFDVPMAYISLVDQDWQWAKAQESFSLRSVLHEFFISVRDADGANPFIVSDLSTTSQFANHPLVTGIPNLRFFVGAPLVLKSGRVAGMLCINDVRTRAFNELDKAVFCSLRDLVVEEIELWQDVSLG